MDYGKNGGKMEEFMPLFLERMGSDNTISVMLYVNSHKFSYKLPKNKS